VTPRQLSLLTDGPLPVRAAVHRTTWAPGTQAAALGRLADAAASADWHSAEAHLLRAAALVEGSSAWAARPYLVKLFVGTAWDRRRRMHCRDVRSVIEQLDGKTRLCFAGVQIVRRTRQVPAPELPVTELVEERIGSSVWTWSLDAPSWWWPDLYAGASVNVWAYPSGRYFAELQVCFPDNWRTQFIMKRGFRSRELAMHAARRWAALGAALMSASGDMADGMAASKPTT
jgi:hypothetical protein